MARDDYREGWAVVDADGINIKTVSDTRRAAIVNWLVVEHGELITNYTQDSQIEHLWHLHEGNAMAVKVRVYAS